MAKASDHFLEDGVRTEQSGRGEDYEPEHGKGRYSRDREWPGEARRLHTCAADLVVLPEIRLQLGGSANRRVKYASRNAGKTIE